LQLSVGDARFGDDKIEFTLSSVRRNSIRLPTNLPPNVRGGMVARILTGRVPRRV
jgi:hypothetical protein